MIKETYYEESAVSQKGAREAKIFTAFTVISIVLFVVAAFILMYAFSFIPYLIGEWNAGTVETATFIYSLVTYLGLVVVIAGAGVLLWVVKHRFNVGYDYVFVEDELRVSKVLNGKNRKFMKSFKADQMLKLGKCDSDGYERACAGLGKKEVRFLTPNKTPSAGKDFYYILYSSSLEKAVYVLEARAELMDLIVRVAGRNKWEAR